MGCPVSGKRHSWVECGLDVVRGRLMHKRRCSYCQKVKFLPYKFEAKKSQRKGRA